MNATTQLKKESNFLVLKPPSKKASNSLYFLFLVLGLFLATNSSAQSIDLGTLSASNIQASSQQSLEYQADEVFNGETSISNDGWVADTDVVQSLSWDFDPYANTQVNTEGYNLIQFSLTIYTGYATIDDLNSFSLRVAGAGEDFSSTVTNFDSLSSVQNYFFENTKTLAISSDASGLITAENPTIETLNQTVHSIVFSAPHTTRRIQLVTPIDDDGFPPHYLINEIETSARAIPEPSTYALLLGVGLLAFVIMRKHNSK